MDYFDNDLAPGRRAEFDRHLAVCPSCVRYMETYRESVRLGRAAMNASDEVALGGAPEALIRAVRAARKQS